MTPPPTPSGTRETPDNTRSAPSLPTDTKSPTTAMPNRPSHRGRRAFTLIELLVVVAIMATMVTVGVVGLNASRGATQVFAAGRDVMAMIRRARSMALVTQKPVVITYSNESADEEPCASITIQADRLFSSKKGTEAVETLSGEVVTEASVGDEGAETGETLKVSPTNLRDQLAPIRQAIKDKVTAELVKKQRKRKRTDNDDE